MTKITKEVKNALRRSLLAHFPLAHVEEKIFPKIRHIQLPANSIVRSSAKVDAMYIVVTGKVGLYNGAAQVGSVIEGRTIELGTYLSGKKEWTCTWKTLADTHLIVIPKSVITSTLKKYKETADYLKLIVSSRAIQRLKHDLNLIGFKPRDIRATIRALTRIPLNEASDQFRDTTLLIIQSGAAEIRSDRGVAVLRANDLIVVNEAEHPTLHVIQEGECWILPMKEWLRGVPNGLVEDALSSLRSEDQDFADVAQSPEFESEVETGEAPEDIDDGEGEEEFSDDDLEKFFVGYERPSAKLNNKFPFLAQHDQTDCGAACMAMILRYHGKNLSIARLRDALNISTAGTSVADLEKCAGEFGFDVLTLETDLDGIKHVEAPWIALQNHHFVVVYKITPTHVMVADPAIGLLEVPREEFENEFSQIATLLRPNDKFKQVREDKLTFVKFAVLLKGHVPDLTRLFAVSLVLFSFGLLPPVLMQIFFDKILAQNQADLLKLFIAGFLCVAVLRILTEWVHEYLVVHLTTRFDAKLNALFSRHLFSLPLSYFSVRRTGDFLSRLEELHKIRDFLLGKPIQVLINFLSIILYAMALAWYHPLLLLVMVVGIPLMAIVAYTCSDRLKQLLDHCFKAGMRADSKHIESITHLDTVRTLNSSISTRWKWEREYENSLKTDRNLQMFASKIDWATQFVDYTVQTVFFLTAAYLYSLGILSLGQTLAASVIGIRLIGPVMDILSEWISLSEVSLSFEKIDDVLRSRSERRQNGARVTKIAGRVELANVSFRYGGENAPEVLSNIHLSIQPGESLALVGPSGSGKSTLANIINLLYQPTSGELLIDGESSQAYDLEHLRRQTSTILQDQVIFRGSIVENIALGDPQPSLERAMAAARTADAHDFIMRLENGYYHHIESGDELSGGERQRISIARAFYHKPKILILDEATSALDGISERKVTQAINKLRGKITVVTVAHRLNSIVHVDRIVVLSNGRIVEEGDHRTLLRKRGHYYKLFRRQLGA